MGGEESLKLAMSMCRCRCCCCCWDPTALPAYCVFCRLSMLCVSSICDADTGGEEVTEPTMFRCCYWGHLNLMDSLDGNGVAASPNVCFLGANSGKLNQARPQHRVVRSWEI